MDTWVGQRRRFIDVGSSSLRDRDFVDWARYLGLIAPFFLVLFYDVSLAFLTLYACILLQRRCCLIFVFLIQETTRACWPFLGSTGIGVVIQVE
jgi:apolipoprotein N-acyltransferase